MRNRRRFSIWAGGLAALFIAGAAPAKGLTLEDLRRRVEADPLLAGVNEDERLVAEIRAQLLDAWEAAFRARDAQAFAALAPAGSWDECARRLRRDRDGIREYAWDCADGAAAVTGAASKVPSRGAGGHLLDAASAARSYLQGFTRVDEVRLEALRLDPAAGGARLELAFDLRGVTTRSARRQDRGTLRAELARDGKSWRLKSLRREGFESVEADRPFFEEQTAAWGLDRVPVVDRREAIRRGGYALAVADYDGDGRPDLLVGAWGPVKLYRNAGKGYEDVTAKAGLAGETLVKSAAFVDLDNDGKRDLLLLRFVEDGKGGDFIAYRNVGGGRFERAGEQLTRTRHYDRTMPLTIADFDLDGTLDLYLGFPGTKDFTTIGRGPQPLATQGVWLNDGKWNFKEVAKESGVWRDNNIYPHSAIATDLNGDGLPDLVVMNDRAGLSPIYRNRGGGMFEEVSRQSGIDNRSWAMTAAAGDYDGDGLPDIAMTNIHLNAGRRILASRGAGRASPEEARALGGLRDGMVGNRLFRNRGDGTFEETTDKAGIRFCGEAAAGAEWIDFNGDGLLDLYVANGLWTGGERDASSLFMRLHADRAAAGVGPIVDQALDSPLAARDPRFDGPNPMLEMLRADPTLSLGGRARHCLFRNNGDGTFTEVGYAAGADRSEDGYVVATADVDGDGRQDLILRNADPAPGRSQGTVTLLRNVGGQRSLTVFVEGARSPRDGFGAIVTAEVGERKLVREVRAVTGASQSEPVAFFGLGAEAQVRRLEVRWPSGIKEEFAGVPAGRVLLREGRGMTTLAAR